MPSAACSEELETLTAIFLDEIIINEELPDDGAQVSMVLFPATGDDEESRYVTLTLEVLLCKNYPKVPPQINFRNPRGLNDEMLEDLMRSMEKRCEESIGSQMVYELIDMGKEFLTRNNRPASECPICLLSFTEFDVFFRSDCFHHFHSHCLGHYLQNILNAASENEPSSSINGRVKQKELNCPVCRERFSNDLDVTSLVAAPPPSEEFESVDKETQTVLQEWEDKRQSMKELYDKQKSQGGIIDLSDKKKLLVISTNRDNSSNGDSAASRGEITSTDSSAGNNEVLVRGEASEPPSAPPCVDESDRKNSQTRQRPNSHHPNSNGQSNLSKSRGIPPPNPNHGVPNNVAANVVASKQNSDSASVDSQQRLDSVADESENGSSSRSGNGNYRRFKRGEGHNRRRHK